MKPKKISKGEGCNCKKTQCQKKYCECYNAGVKCGETCKCIGCHNKEEGEEVLERESHLSELYQ